MGKAVRRSPLTEDQRNLVACNLGLARRLAGDYARRYPCHRDEFLSVAYLGLTEAARSYDDTRKFKFSTLAYRYIIGEIREFLRSARLSGYRYRFKDDDCPSVMPLGLDREWDFLAVDRGPDREAVRLADLVSELIRGLPRRHAMVCRLHDLDGIALREIARRMGVSYSWVAMLHSEAIKMMRERRKSVISV